MNDLIIDEHSPTAKVLVVDDQTRNLIAVDHVLSDLNVEVVMVNSGIDALKELLNNEFCLILLDVQMPGMDGFETAELIRSNPLTTNVPIIFMTAFSKDQAYQIKGYKSGAVDYLIKPVNDFILENKVKIFIELFQKNNSNLNKLVKKLSELKIKLELKNKELSNMVTKDPLTQLSNRRSFEDALQISLSYAMRHNKEIAILFFDLDNFKFINDSYGHHIGDDLLKYVTGKLKSTLRKEDFLARLGGDEFGLIIDRDISIDHITQKAKRINQAFSDTFEIKGISIKISSSIGIACYPFAGNTVSELIKNADIAMYRAKYLGKNQHQFYSEELSKSYNRKLLVEKYLKIYLNKKSNFYMVYQPIYKLSSNMPIGVETLVRWECDELGSVSPDEFIPIAEECGLIEKLGKMIFNKSLKHISMWNLEGINNIKVAINISSLQLNSNNLSKYIQKLLKKYDVNPKNIEFELTETALMRDQNKEFLSLQDITKVGINISLDDFGTGHSSLVRLVTLPLSTMKIDRTFIKDVDTDKNKSEIVKVILRLAKVLNLKIVAEGVETKNEYLFLKEHECEFAQGFYMSKPLEAKEISNLFKSNVL